MLKLPSTICNLTNYLHTHLGRAFDNNVQKQQGKQISIDLFMNKNHSPSLVLVSTSQRPLRHWFHCPPATFTKHPMSGASLIHQRQRAATIWRWDVVFTNMFSLLILSHLVKFDSSVRCATHHTSHTNLNPIHHPGAQITSLKYIFPTKGCSGKRWDMTCNLFICNFLAILLIYTLLVKHDNKTLYNNQPSNQLLKNQGR